MDVSAEGVRLEIAGGSPSTLPPVFTLKIPGFGVQAKVKRVWVAMPAQGSVWCGGILERQTDKADLNWRKFITNSPNMGQHIIMDAPPTL
jgi:hypothetical protein